MYSRFAVGDRGDIERQDAVVAVIDREQALAGGVVSEAGRTGQARLRRGRGARSEITLAQDARRVFPVADRGNVVDQDAVVGIINREQALTGGVVSETERGSQARLRRGRGARGEVGLAQDTHRVLAVTDAGDVVREDAVVETVDDEQTTAGFVQ